jgi:heptosyltransferase-3
MPPAFTNILLIQLGDIGDVVVTTPTIRAVKETWPDARVSILVRKPFGSLLASDPHLHGVIESSKPNGSTFHAIKEYSAFARRLRSASYDLAIDLRTGDRGAIFAFLTGARERVGRPGRANQFWHDLLFTRVVRNPILDPSAHPGADQSLRIVRELGIETKNSLPQLNVSPVASARALAMFAECGLAPDARRVTINPFSRWKYKEWNSTKWGEVIDYLWEKYQIPSVLIGSHEEAVACEEIAMGRESHAFNLAGKTNLGELAALLSTTTLHLGVDSAAPHIAAALGMPTITVHGPSDWRGWSIVDDLHKIAAAPMECVPCSRRGCDDTEISQCLEKLGVETVIGIIEDLLLKLTIKQ